jgi:hypothetical protein
LSILTKPKAIPADPAALYRCIDPFVCRFGTYVDGQKLRGSDPAIAAYPDKFVEADLPDSEVAQAIATRFPGQPIRYS